MSNSGIHVYAHMIKLPTSFTTPPLIHAPKKKKSMFEQNEHWKDTHNLSTFAVDYMAMAKEKVDFGDMGPAGETSCSLR